ncbi:MAG: rhomboid family intramembrane serine protease [Acidobacteriales bacterium]|nr:MAG: rhomboid family intramembrane serine protease [Terriglobales bacterium]
MIPLRDSQPSYSKPFVTIALIFVNVLAFLYEISLDAFSLNNLMATYGLIPSRFQLTALATSMFLHGGWLHLLGNMWFLWIFGDNVEDILGRWKYLTFYLLCGIAAGLVHVIFNSDSRLPTVGASGAIAGVMGAYLLKFPHSRIVTLVPIVFFLTTIEIPASVLMIVWFAIQFFSGVGSIGYSDPSQGGVAWFAHVGGFLAGMALILALRPRDPYQRRAELHW